MRPPYRLRYIPQWMTPAFMPATGTAFGGFWAQSAGAMCESLSEAVHDIALMGGYEAYGLPRLSWVAPGYAQIPSGVNITCTNGATTVTARPAWTEHDFFTATDPVWCQADTLEIWVRNVERVTVTVVPASGYTVATEPLVPDSDVYYLQSPAPIWRRLPANSDNCAASGLLVLPTLDPCQVCYSSASGAALWTASGTAQWNGGPQLPLIENDLENDWDGVGLELDLPRFPGETNVDYAARLADVYATHGSPTYRGVVRGAARRLDRVVTTSWDTATPMTFPASAVLGDVHVHGLPPDIMVTETLISDQNGVYWLLRIPDPGSLHILESATTLLPIDVSADGSNFQVSGAAAGQPVTIRYSYTPYLLTVDDFGNVVSLAAAPGNLVQQTLVVSLYYGVRVHNMSTWDPLFLPGGAASPLMKELGLRLQQTLMYTFGYGLWGFAQWFRYGGVLPSLGRALDALEY